MYPAASNQTWPLPTADPEELGFSSDRLARIGSFFQQKYLAPGKLPCVVTMVARHGMIVYFGAQGYMDLENQKPVQGDTVFRMYSSTKPITAAARPSS